MPVPSTSAALESAFADMDARARAVESALFVEAIYDRDRDLPRILPGISAAELADTTAAGAWNIVFKLQRAYAAEQNCIRNGHWTAGGLPRLTALRQAIYAESRRTA